MKAYRIKDWGDIYENNRSRTVKELQWVAIPNRHDGEGFKLVMQHDRASEIFTAFILILQVASRCQPRGTLIRDGKPHNAASLALKTGGRQEWFEIALEFLSSPEIGWVESLEVTDGQVIARQCHPTDSQPAVDSHPTDSQVTKKEGMERREGMPPVKNLSPSDTVKFDGELRRITEELKKHGKPDDYPAGGKTQKQIVEWKHRQSELRKLLGVKA